MDPVTSVVLAKGQQVPGTVDVYLNETVTEIYKHEKILDTDA